eukprot:CAMPEP_0113506850 /NCGR_PEP_ID=MMETSP0014_2-20120614/36137_1 /TAXON_ID=2857 /ORGANISM="Nitzschia sp." /LENGTH=438 /DNA_ID=CAMNT_0000402391 /DNA_START=150 /DNA_END=1466 /DNA_ORIENTATION=- /assembly_acc=CAM_ASM_000159
MASSSSSSSSSSNHGEEEQRPASGGPPAPPPMPRRQQQQQRSRVIEEEMPEYRSVMISGSVAPPMPLSFSAPAAKQSPGSTMTTTSASGKIAGSDVRPSSVVVDTFLSSWKKCPPAPLTRGYPLERTHVRIEDATVPSTTVTERICQTVKDLSLASSCNEDEDKNVLVVETLCGIKFAVQLFEQKGTTIVEVQRMCGCCVGFREAARAVLRSAQGLEHAPAPMKRRSVPSSLPPRPEETQTKCIAEDCSIAVSLLSGREDQQLLGLDSLEQMTRASTDSCKMLAAKNVLSFDCLQRLVSLLEVHFEEAAIASTTTPTDVPNHSFLIKRKILTVLANACSALSKSDLCTVLSESESDLLVSQPLLSMLLSTLQEADPKMNDAEQACRCLRSLLVSRDAESAMSELRAVDAVSYAYSVGCSSHSGLEKESKKLLVQLRSG